MPRPSTFSIVACDLQTSAYGIAVASKFLAVGAVVPWAKADAGAIATQSFANTSYGPLGLELMADGISANEALHRLTGSDPQADQRQAGFVDFKGGSATYTGASCYDWAGGRTGPGYAIQGNILAGPQVVKAMEAAYLQSAGQPIARRLYAALLAGDRAGGDRRGRQSAAILVVKPKGGYGGFNDRWMDYRVDDHPDPVVRLAELLDLHDLYFDQSPETEKIALPGPRLSRFQSILQKLDYYQGEFHGQYDDATRKALVAFIGNENFEERFDDANCRLDLPVVEYLLNRYKV
jgi:uncharacterized Ntn-hydrolase superfamily protein